MVFGKLAHYRLAKKSRELFSLTYIRNKSLQLLNDLIITYFYWKISTLRSLVLLIEEHTPNVMITTSITRSLMEMESIFWSRLSGLSGQVPFLSSTHTLGWPETGVTNHLHPGNWKNYPKITSSEIRFLRGKWEFINY